jgi:hypothetical protein
MDEINKDLAFLFGSGISIPAGLPSTSGITERVLSGKDVSRHTSTIYYNGPPMFGSPDEYIPKVNVFLKRLKSEIDIYYSYDRKRIINYEDLYSLASQIHDSESKNYDNPAIFSFIKQILADSKDILSTTPYIPEHRWSLIDLSSEVTNYIRDIVLLEMAIQPKKLEYLNFIIDAVKDSYFNRKRFFTLNHDVLLESLFNKYSISFIDGFDQPVSQLRRWNPKLFESNQVSVYLLKLHGSINWYFLEEDGSYTLSTPLNEFWQNNPRVNPLEDRPEILVGTLNKILQYSNPIYLDLQCSFNRLLNHSAKLIVSGYSFGDKAINSRIIQWLDSLPSRKIIIIHPDPNYLLEHVRNAIRISWHRWLDDKKLFILQKSVEETNWDELKKMLTK